MNKTLYAKASGVLLALLMLGLTGCGEKEQPVQSLEPVGFHADDECHVCGMVVLEFPGAKGQAVEKGSVKNFCSTGEMIGWWLQPENRVLDARLYVHDMAHGTWENPDDSHLIDAKSAWYVAGTSLKGAMGAVLASFADEAAARKLAEEHGGRVLRFEEIDQAVLQEASGMEHMSHEEHLQHMQDMQQMEQMGHETPDHAHDHAGH